MASSCEKTDVVTDVVTDAGEPWPRLTPWGSEFSSRDVVGDTVTRPCRLVG
ncbi:MAG: hypothetical protein ACTSRF_09300 [Candidatus Freyarchaeota archaeon]